ncbi:MAG: hypothetical protein ACHQCI_10480, partial [Solirubrobacterales bacterium]
MRRIILALGLVALLAAVGVTVAVAAKPGNGQSNGSGTVFLPNPVADLQNQSLTDQKDADYPALAAGNHKGRRAEGWWRGRGGEGGAGGGVEGWGGSVGGWGWG